MPTQNSRMLEINFKREKNEKTGQYDITLDVDTYMKLYESAKKIERGLVDPKTEVQEMRTTLNNHLPLSRRVRLNSIPKTHQPAQITTKVELNEVTPIEPKAKNVVLASSTAEVGLVTTTVEPVATTVEPVATTVEPVATTVEPVATTAEPVATTVEPVATTVEPVATTVEPVATTVESVATIAEPLAQDRVIVPVGKSVSVPSISSSPRVSSAGEVDPITQAIRDEVLTKQQLYLQQEIAKTIPVAERNHFLDQDLSSFRAFLQTDNGKENLSSAMQKPETENELKHIESNGYKEVHSQFQDSFKKVDWVSPPNSKTRLSEIKDADGQHITSLKETTVQGAATQVALEDGTMRSIKSYRQIEFPKEIEGGKGPAHFSMAVKDENGRNVPEKAAVYFTAHYDDKGKLTEVSSPVPVKFMGKGDDAIGYIERGGKVYTLPVTQGKYKEMMLKVEANKGMGANVSQSIEVAAIAQDKVTTVKVSPKIAELASDIGNIYKKKMSEHESKPAKIRPRSASRGGETIVH